MRRVLPAAALAAAVSLFFSMPAWAAPTVPEAPRLILSTEEETQEEMPAIGLDTEEDPDLFWVLNEETGLWYCEHSDGTPATGWQRKGDYVYFMNSRGNARTGWIKSYGKWYYLCEDESQEPGEPGALVTDAWIDNYYVDENGVKSKVSRDFFK